MAAACAIGGSLIGTSILFGIARKGGEVLLSKYISGRRGKVLHSWFERYGLITVFVPALSPLPLPMKIPVFCAGALEVRWPYFLAVVFAARAVRYCALAYLGLHYGQQSWQFLRAHIVRIASLAVALSIIAVIVLQIAGRRESNRSKAAILGE